ncbi:hypothetical protein SUDANB1_07559 [Streptomyces sp. enrichment culture]
MIVVWLSSVFLSGPDSMQTPATVRLTWYPSSVSSVQKALLSWKQ